MSARLAAAVERSIELIAPTFLAGAVGFSAYVLPKTLALFPLIELRLFAAAAAGAAFLLGRTAIRAASGTGSAFALDGFSLTEFPLFGPQDLLDTADEPLQADELVLSEDDRLDRAPHDPSADPLVLDDVLARIDSDSRVVQLFDRKAMPTPGQLQSRIEDHLGQRGSARPADASQALAQALSELRRSLR